MIDTPSRIVTFYSYKGGVGRSFLLASVAATLARWGWRVLCLDWDLEAPGLGRFFAPFVDADGPGLVDMVEDLAAGARPDVGGYTSTVTLLDDLTLDFVRAGSADRYAERLQALDWDTLYRDHDFGGFLEGMRDTVRRSYDIVLADSRTGLSDTGGICAVQLPDVVVMVYTANEQSLLGSRDIGRRITVARDGLAVDRLPAPIIPILSRFDAREERVLGRQWQQRSAEALAELFVPWLPDGADVLELVERTTVPYVSYWSFGERIPVLEERPGDPESLSYSIETVTALVASDLGSVRELLTNRDEFVDRSRSDIDDENRTYDFFVSSGVQNRVQAAELVRALRVRGASVWWDDAVPVAAVWNDEIRNAATASQHAVMMVHDGLTGFQETEVRYFRNEQFRRPEGSRIIPVLTKSSSELPAAFADYQYVRWTNAEEVADALVGLLPHADPRPSRPTDALTERELDILRLVAEGRTNREIADQLFISQKTVSVHLSHILAKLGVRTRTQAAALFLGSAGRAGRR